MYHIYRINVLFVLQSSPQILLTTAFIVQATPKQSPIVYISLLTSFWSLCHRVATDDKQIVYRESKDMIIYETSNGKKKMKLNYRWVIRVLLWRFLEISSRICIFTLIWLNLGGISVFIILSAELLYVMVLSYECKRSSIYP